MKIKKLLSMLLVGTATVSLLAGCGSASTENTASQDTEAATESEQETQTEAAETETTQNTEEVADTSDTEEATGNSDTADSAASGDTQAAADTESQDGGTLVVYYSATGSTEAVANTIAEAAGADLFELVPTEPYTDEDLDWTNDDSRVSVEHENEDQREVELVSTTVDNWESYDTVLIGYPIWWAIAAWPVDSFVENNDFTGKTVIPFCTSASSGLGESGELLAEMAGTGDWQEGERFRSGASESDVQAWVEELGLTE